MTIGEFVRGYIGNMYGNKEPYKQLFFISSEVGYEPFYDGTESEKFSDLIRYKIEHDYRNLTIFDYLLENASKDSSTQNIYWILNSYISRKLNFILKGQEYYLNGLYKTTMLEYNPTENYNMMEKSIDENILNETNKNDLTSKTTNTGTVSSLTGQYSDTNTNSKAPYDNNIFYSNEQTVLQHGSHTDTTTNNLIDNNTTGGSGERHNVNNLTHELTRSGNIGVTTTQDMIISERNVVNMYLVDVIARIIVKEICYMNY